MTNQQGAPEALRPITRYEVVDCIDSKHVPAVIPNKDGPWVRYEDHAAALVEAQQPAPSAAAFDEHGFRDWVLRNLPKGSVIGNGEWWADHLTSWAKRFVKAAPQPSTTPQADSAKDEPLQAFDSPRAKALMRAWEEGWAACRDAEYVGEEAQNDAFNSSNTLTLCIAEDQQLPAPQADSQPAPYGKALSVQGREIEGSEMKPSEYLRDCVLFTPQVFSYKRKYSQAKNIADMYLTDSDAARWLTYHDYLMFVLMCAEDLANESMAKIVSATPPAPSEQ